MPDVKIQIVKKNPVVKIQGAVINKPFVGDSLSKTIEAGETLSALKVIRNDVSNKAFVADSSDINDLNRVIGISKTSSIIGASFQYIISGAFEDALWNWDVTKPIFFDNNGSLTQTTPVSGFTQIVAVPITDKIINVTIKQAIKLI